MIYGSNSVEEYSTVQAFTADPSDSGIISGGTGDSTVVVGGVRFYWIYNPQNPSGPGSGFTGCGWFETIDDTPIKVCGKPLSSILDQFADGTRSDLNDVFSTWQSYVIQQAESGRTGIVSNFEELLGRANGWDCWNQ